MERLTALHALDVLPKNIKHRSFVVGHMNLNTIPNGIVMAIACLLTACDQNDEGEVTRERILGLEVAAARYKADCNQFPGKAEDLRKDPGVTGWLGPYSTEILDAWGVPFHLNIVEGQLEIRSFGPPSNKKPWSSMIGNPAGWSAPVANSGFTSARCLPTL